MSTFIPERISRQASSKYTPFFLMYNRHPRKAVTCAMESEEEEKESKDDEVESEQEDAEDLDVVLEKLLELHKACHFTAKRISLQLNRSRNGNMITSITLLL